MSEKDQNACGEEEASCCGGGGCEKRRFLGVMIVRAMGLLFMVSGLIFLIGNTVEFLGEFDPVYLGVFLRAQLLKPLLFLVLGAFFWKSAPALGRRLSGF